MNIEVVSKDIKLTDAMYDHIDELEDAIESFLTLKPTSVRLEIKQRANTFKLEAMIFFKNDQFIRQEVSNEDFYVAINQLINRLKKQMRKLKAKLNDKNRDLGYEVFSDAISIEQPELNIRHKTVNLKPMDEEEALLQIEALGLDFFVFLDLEDNFKVLYKRNNGYGLINFSNE